MRERLTTLSNNSLRFQSSQVRAFLYASPSAGKLHYCSKMSSLFIFATKNKGSNNRIMFDHAPSLNDMNIPFMLFILA